MSYSILESLSLNQSLNEIGAKLYISSIFLVEKTLLENKNEILSNEKI